jgi:hypothetical protein
MLAAEVRRHRAHWSKLGSWYATTRSGHVQRDVRSVGESPRLPPVWNMNSVAVSNTSHLNGLVFLATNRPQ